MKPRTDAFWERSEVPWGDSEKWKPGWFYPLPSSHDVEFEGEELTIHVAVWDLYQLEPASGPPLNRGDIVGLGLSLTFAEAVKIANRMNPRKLWTFSWAKELE